MLVAFSGKARVGKDTATQYLVEKYGFNQIALADPVKHGANNMNPWISVEPSDWEKISLESRKQLSREGTFAFYRLKTIIEAIGIEEAKKIEEVRKTYQLYGTEGGRHIHGDDCWLRIAKRRFTGKDAISDVRFSNEAEFVHENGGIVVNLTRDAAEEVSAHSSENGLCSEYYDVLIENNGTVQDLYKELDKLIA